MILSSFSHVISGGFLLYFTFNQLKIHAITIHWIDNLSYDTEYNEIYLICIYSKFQYLVLNLHTTPSSL